MKIVKSNSKSNKIKKNEHKRHVALKENNKERH